MSLSLHDKNNNPLKFESNFKERLSKHKTLYAYTEEHDRVTKEFAEKHGRAWWIFCGVSVIAKYKNQWIEQFRVIDGETNE